MGDNELTEALVELPGWERVGDKLSKSFLTRNFVDAVEFIRELSEMAEAECHHPDIHLTQYKHLEVVYWSHDCGEAGGLTQNDIICAAKTDVLWIQHAVLG